MGDLNFRLGLVDAMSGVVKKIGGITHSVFARIDGDVKRTRSNMDGLGRTVKLQVDSSGIRNAKADIDELKATYNTLNERGSMGGGMGFMKTGAAMWLGSMATQATMMAGRKLYETGADALGNGIDYQNAIVGLETFMGEKEAYRVVDRVAREGARTPYTTKQLLPIEQGLISAGGKTPDRAHRDTWALANAVAATGGGNWALERMGVLHMPQIAAEGYMQGLQRREFTIAHIPIDKILADYLNVKQSTIPGMVRDKKITYDILTNAMEKTAEKGGMFAGAMDRLSQTIGGKWSTILDKMQISGWKLTESQDRNIKRLEDRMISFADELPKMAGKMAPVIDRLFDEFNELVPSMKGFGGALLDDLRPVGSFLMGKPFEQLAKNAMDLSTAFLKNLTPAIKAVADAASGITSGVNQLLSIRTGIIDWANKKLPAGATSFMTGGLPGLIGHEYDKHTGLRAFWAGLTGTQDDFIKNEIHTKELGKHNVERVKGLMKASLFGKSNFAISDLMNGITGSGHNDKVNGMGAGAQGGSDAIVGGGRKQVTININAPFYRVDHQVFQNQMKQLEDMEQRVKEIYVRILRGVPGMA